MKKVVIFLFGIILSTSLLLLSCGGGGGGGGGSASGASIPEDEYSTHNPSGWDGTGAPIDSGNTRGGNSGITVQGNTPLTVTGYTYNGNNYPDINSLGRALKNDNVSGQITVSFTVAGETTPRTARVTKSGDGYKLDHQYKATFITNSGTTVIFYYISDGINLASMTTTGITGWQGSNGVLYTGSRISGLKTDIILTAVYSGSPATVSPAAVSLSISGESTFEAGSTLDLSAVITDVPAGVSVSYSWTSSDTSIATVTAGAANPATAVVTGVSAGSVTITVQASLSDGRTVNTTKDITVAAAGSLPVPAGMVYVAGGTSGSNTIPNLYVCDHEVTWYEYQTYCYTHITSWEGTNYPAYCVSLYDAFVYCNLRSIAERRQPCYTINGSTDPNSWPDIQTGTNGKLRGTGSDNSAWNSVNVDKTKNGYRLPTSDEWKWAAKGGTNRDPYQYAGSDDIDDVAWYRENSGDNGTSTNRKSHPVKGKQPNSLGLYDMSGNIKEWIVNGMSSLYYYGGSYSDVASDCTVTSYVTSSVGPTYRYSTTGFRVVYKAE